MTVGHYQERQSNSESPRQREHRIFADVTAALERNRTATYVTAELGAALLRNKQLWDTLVADLVHDENQLPGELKNQLISLGVWVSRHTDSVMGGRAKVDALIDVNTSIIRGLMDPMVSGPTVARKGVTPTVQAAVQ